MAHDGFIASLLSDLRVLSNEARKAEGLAGQLTGWISGPEHPAIKEAAERASLKMKGLQTEATGEAVLLLKDNKVQCSVIARINNPEVTVASTISSNNTRIALQEILKPFLMACETKSAKLANISLASLQKMLANDILVPDEILLVIKALEQVMTLAQGIELARHAGQKLCRPANRGTCIAGGTHE